MFLSRSRWLTVIPAAAVWVSAPALSQPRLGPSCTVSALNRTVQADERGVWVLPNVPAGTGPVRLRATCVDAGVTRTGQSPFFLVPANGILEVEQISFDAQVPVPATLTLTSPTPTLTAPGQTVQLSARVAYPDGTVSDVTGSELGTSFTSSNPGVATVNPVGLVTAQRSGVALVTAAHEGTVAVLRLTVVAGADSDGDGLPDDWEIANGLDPNDAVDGVDDVDADGLTAAQELSLGSDPRNPDSDGDGLTDGDEALRLGTDPVRRDSDGDQVSDGLEVRAGSDPLDPASVALEPILTGVAVEPSEVTLVFNAIVGEASRQVTVWADLVDGSRIDATRRFYGTTYASSDLAVASFGSEDGRIFGGAAGSATVTARIGSRSATVAVTVQSFAPQPLSFVAIPGRPSAVAVDGDYAYVAAGPTGLHVLDVSDPTRPSLVASLDTPGFAGDVQVSGGYAYVADGVEGLFIADVSLPSAPLPVASLATPGPAVDATIQGDRALVAFASGLVVVDVATPHAPVILGSLALCDRCIEGLDGERSGRWAVLAGGLLQQVYVVDLADPTAPRLAGSVRTRGRAKGVVARGRLAYVADYLAGLTVVDFSLPEAPFVLGSNGPGTTALVAVVLDLEHVLGADVLRQNVVPIFHAAPQAPVLRATLDFFLNATFRDDDGTGIAVRDGLVFLTAVRVILGQPDGGLHIGRYRLPEDTAGLPPAVDLTAPDAGSSVPERRSFTLRADARDDVRVVGVRFLSAGEEVSFDYTPPYEAMTAPPPGAERFTVSAVALDAAGSEGTADSVEVVTIPDPHPAVDILSPASASSVVEGSELLVVTTASDDHAVVAVELFADGVSQGRDADAPYAFEIRVPIDVPELELIAVATDDAGNEATATRTVEVLPDPPPFVAFLVPAVAREVVAGALVPVLLGAYDDLGIASLELLANGVAVAPRPGEGDAFDVIVPGGVTELRLIAAALDVNGQRATAELVFPVVGSDPLTRVVGEVVDADGAPVAGVEVACLGVASVSIGDGSFSIAGVPTTSGSISCSASFRDSADRSFSGRSGAATPVSGGVTEVGTIVLRRDGAYLYPGAQLAAGSGSRSVAAADLDGDGRLDLLACDPIADAVAVLRGSGEGIFELPVVVAVGQSPEDLTLADFDADGRLDIATANRSGGDVSVALGHGDGSFGVARSFAAGSGPTAITAGDVDGDGDVDLVVSLEFADRVVVLANDGEGSFDAGQTIATGNGPEELLLQDFDGDGRLDLAVVHRFTSRVPLYRGNGDGTFALRRQLEPSGVSHSIAGGDFDGDGWIDLVLGTTAFSDRVDLYRGAADWSFPRIATAPVGGEPDSLLAADLDADGRLDLAVTLDDTYELAVLRGVGDGTLEAAREVPAGAFGQHVVSGDLDGDGRLDLVIGDAGGVTLLFGRGGLDFDTRQRSEFLPSPYAAHVADLNGDHAADIMHTSVATDEVVVHLGRGDGTFLPPRSHATASGPFAMTVADANADGHADVIAAGYWEDEVSVLLGIGDGTLAPGPRLAVGECPEGVAAVDLDGDGVVDLISANNCSDDVSVLLGTGGGFATERRFAVGTSPRGIAVADVDGDGFPDLAVTAEVEGGGAGGGSAASTSEPHAASVERLAGTARRRSDPRLRLRALTAMSHSAGELWVLLGNGDGTFGSPRQVEVGLFPAAVVAQDFDGDGRVDLATANYAGSDISVLLGNGDGTFDAETRYPTGGFGTEVLRAHDLDGDGAVDLVAASNASHNVTVLLGRGDGTFSPPQLYATGGCPYGLAVGDLDGNGRSDLVTADNCSDALSILLHE